MNASAIEVAIDIGEQVALGPFSGRSLLLMDRLDLRRVEDALHRHVAVATAFAAHRVRGFDQAELLLVDLGGILAAAIGVADEPSAGPLSLHRHHQGAQGQLGSHVAAHPLPAFHRLCWGNLGRLRPAYDLPGG